MRFRGQNPVYKRMEDNFGSAEITDSATYTGVTIKTGILLGIVATIAMYFAYTLQLSEITTSTIIALIVSPIVAIIMVIVTHRKPQIAIFTSIIYAICEGVFIGFISAIFAFAYGGEIIQMALTGTFGVLGGMLFLYATGIIRVGGYFRRSMYAMLIGLLASSLILLVLYLVGFTGIAFESFYIGIVALSVIISSLYLLVDFDNISRMVNAGAPKEYEWSLALGLVVTLIWLYVELLRLIAIVMNRRR